MSDNQATPATEAVPTTEANPDTERAPGEPDRPPDIPIHVPPPPDQRSGLPVVAQARYLQEAWVVACLRANYIDGQGRMTTRQITQYLPLNQQGVANLVAEGIPEGSLVTFSSHVQAVGEYTHPQWFIVGGSSRRGAEYSQRGTAFRGWFTFEGLYDT